MTHKTSMTIRAATYADVPALAQRWYDEKAKTCFSQLQIVWTVSGCATFLTEIMGLPQYMICVIERDGQIIAACGSLLQQDLLPPHPIVVGEWMWWGSDKRAIVEVLRMSHTWGKSHGATLARYTLNQPGQSPTKFSETYRWEVL